MRPPIDGGIILLTGASSGIGRAMAIALGGRAHTLIVVARREGLLQALKADLIREHPDLQVDVRCCDLSDVNAAKNLVDDCLSKHGKIDVLINNAGFGSLGLFHQIDCDRFEKMIQLNISTLTVLCRKVLPGMVSRGSGGILNVSSGFGLTWSPFFSVYCATKQYVTAFTDSLRAELSGTGVVVSQLCPGPVKTEFMSVAGHADVVQAPSIIELSAQRCASIGLKQFSRGKALTIPGFWVGFGMWLLPIVPRWLMRFVYGITARRFREKLKS